MKTTINTKLMLLSGSLTSILIIVIGLSLYTFNLLKSKDSINKSLYYLAESYKSFMIFSEDRNIINKEYFEFTLHKLNEEISNNNLSEKESLSSLLNSYDSLFKRYYTLSEKRGLNENLGIEGNFRKSAHDLEFILANKNLKQIQVDLLQIRRREKDYLMRKNPVYVQMISENIKSIKNMINQLNLDNKLKKEVGINLDNYLKDFKDIVAILDSIEAVSSKIKLVQNEANIQIQNEVEIINQYADKVINFIIIFFVISIILMIYLANRLSKSIQEPIHKLSKIVKNISSDNFSLRAKIFTDDEVGELALSFNKMLDKLENAYHQVELANQNLEEKVKNRTEELSNEIEERKIYEEKLKTALEKINKIKEELDHSLLKERELNLLKTRFVSMISHEYRTPLTVIMTSTYLLEKYFEMNDLENFKAKIQNIQSSIDSMKTLLEDTLTIDRLESGYININKTKIDLVELIKVTKHESELLLKPKQTIEFTSNVDKIYLESDHTLIKHIFSNLISNAIKYSPKGSNVKLNINKTDDYIIVDIIDEGIGIPKENQDKLFSPFYRADNVETIQGTGLGLSIVKKFIELIKAEIYFNSIENFGTTFTVRFHN
jgi:signal transduction histidine kinase